MLRACAQAAQTHHRRASTRRRALPQVDFFGVKRGGCVESGCPRYEGKVIQSNHCSGPSDTTLLHCLRCGRDAAQHESLGSWEPGQPMLVNEQGQRFKTLHAVGR